MPVYRLLLLLSVLLAVTAGCRKRNRDAPVPPDPNAAAQTDPTNWPAIPLNSTYTIRFPANYDGPGGLLFEGWTFGKTRADKRATFGYSFCGPLNCDEYGPMLLVSRDPSPISYKGQTLPKSIDLANGGQLIGRFYYSEQTNAVGVLYLQTTRLQVRESLSVTFDNALQAEVLAIIRTIRVKN